MVLLGFVYYYYFIGKGIEVFIGLGFCLRLYDYKRVYLNYFLFVEFIYFYFMVVFVCVGKEWGYMVKEIGKSSGLGISVGVKG